MPTFTSVPYQPRVIAPKVVNAYARNAALYNTARPAAGPHVAMAHTVGPSAHTPEQVKQRQIMEAMQRMLGQMHHNGQTEQPEYKELFGLYKEVREIMTQEQRPYTTKEES